MIEYALFFAASCYGLALLLDLWRIAVGPDAADRILALDTMVINIIALLVLYGVWRGTAIYFEPAMLIAMGRQVAHHKAMRMKNGGGDGTAYHK
jgi:multicomponent K+:H+ antiporter subunit F